MMAVLTFITIIIIINEIHNIKTAQGTSFNNQSYAP